MDLEGKHIGIIAGAGDLPHAVIAAAQHAGAIPYVLAVAGSAVAEDFPVDGICVGIAEFGKMTKMFSQNKCDTIIMAGYVKRPDFKHLKPDFKAVKYLPAALKAATEGDDALLSFIIKVFEKEGYEVLSPQDICEHLLMPSGVLGAIHPKDEHQADIDRALDIAAAIGRHDIGQGAIICNGLILAVEAQEGTDAMLGRINSLDKDIRGRPDARRGVLAKRVKPGQEDRVDLPTIGPNTIRLASEAGLCGIVLETGRAFVMDREQVIQAADQDGLFVLGVDSAKL